MSAEWMPPQPRPHISFSEWGQFKKECQHRWSLDYLKGLRKRNFSVHMDFGSAIHSAIELRGKNESVTIQAQISHFEEEFNSLLFQNGLFYRDKEKKDLSLKGYDFFLNAGRKIISEFFDCPEIAQSKILYNELELNLPMEREDEIKINFKGFIDMVVMTKDARGNSILYVCDFKTCSWGWDRDKRQDKQLHFQILLYKHFLCKKFDLDPKMVRVAFVLLKKRPAKGTPPVEFFPISAGPISVQRALDSLNEDVTEMEARRLSGKFVKNRANCQNAFGDICPYLHTEHCPD